MHRDQILKYFDEKSSASEKRRLFLHLKKNPELLTASFSEEDWLSFMQSGALSETGPIMQELLDQIAIRKRRRMVRVYQAITSAAIFIIVLCSGLVYHYDSGILSPKKKVPLGSLRPMIEYNNTTATTKKLLLPDGTIVCLESGGKIGYKRNFEPSKRDIYLEGSASFKVAKNTLQPFTVYCREVATTALGTEFYVNSKGGHKISVKLIEGKVLVRSLKDTSDVTQKHYLVAGNAITFDREANRFSGIGGTKIAASLKITEPKKTANKQYQGEALTKVLSYIADTYNVTIDYDPELISHIRFAGTLQHAEPVLSLLQNIALMNSFILIRDSSANGVRYFLK